MNRYLLGSALAGVLMLAASVGAQDAPQNPSQNPPQNPPRSAAPPAQEQARTATATVEGCLVREADVPGRKPSIAERAGIAEDYILTSAKVVKGAAPEASKQASKPGDAPTGTSGTQAMFQIQGIDDEKLQSLVGRRVQVEGTFESAARTGASPESKAAADDLTEIRATTIRQVAGECPAKP